MAATASTRIHVGGLGQSVSSDDLRKVFSAVGTVEGLDIIRAKGRSFAYVDILPSSSNSLSKLFNTYNGCVWKGGKLKLGKAKEHYLTRLKREWAKEEEEAHHQPMPSSSDEPYNGNKVHVSQQGHLRIFFPRLTRVKSLPLSGTGKHKYSFQRVEVSALPIHFCDCEEHSGHFNAVRRKEGQNHEEINGVMNEEEVSMMSSVMNKLFERANISNTSSAILADEREDFTKLIEGPLSDEEETDDDDLIINVVSDSNNRAAMSGSREKKAVSTERFKSSEKQTSEDGPIQNEHKVQKDDILLPNRNEKGNVQTQSNESVVVAQTTGAECGLKQSNTSCSWSQKSSWRALVGDRSNSAFSLSNILQNVGTTKEKQQISDGCKVNKTLDSRNGNLAKPKNLEGMLGKTEIVDVEPQPNQPKTASSNSGRGSSWLHKSSWMQLVSENSSSFSISEIVPGSTTKQECTKPIYEDVVYSADGNHSNKTKSHKSEPTVYGSPALGVRKEGDTVRSIPESNQQTVVGNTDASVPTVEKCNSEPDKAFGGDTSIGETCSFMRSSASLKEWVKTKAALKGSRKKKR
ncbi:RNA-binding family protein, putative isoform 2 [Theobroma cacao]|uniref:RNA-binding family protein, putative isoform 2 n=1 Tax=Theobroma cacao TaxID=3641 RepID=A0A061GRV1_THECC|nr:RNA-binding family protein, putative isoform 2 [Theobroma cacao]